MICFLWFKVCFAMQAGYIFILLRVIFGLLFSKLFPVIFSWWLIYSFPVIFIYKRIHFWYSLRTFFTFLHDLMGLLLSSLIGFIVDILFFIQSGESTMFQIYFMTIVMRQINVIKNKIITSCWCFRPNLLFILRSDSKSSSITSSTLS